MKIRADYKEKLPCIPKYFTVLAALTILGVAAAIIDPPATKAQTFNKATIDTALVCTADGDPAGAAAAQSSLYLSEGKVVQGKTALQSTGSLIVYIYPDGLRDIGAEWRLNSQSEDSVTVTVPDGGRWWVWLRAIGDSYTDWARCYTNDQVVAERSSDAWHGIEYNTFETGPDYSSGTELAIGVSHGSLQVGSQIMVQNSSTGEVRLLYNAPNSNVSLADFKNATWHRSGEIVSGIDAGIHTIEFKDVTGWIKPVNKAVSIYSGKTTTANAQYTQCSYSIRPASRIVPAMGATGQTIQVYASGSCAWTATGNTSWITITSAKSGIGNGTITYSVSANAATSERTGTITVAGQVHTISQGSIGKQWNPVYSSGPSTRYGTAMAYDSARRRTVLFGGEGKSSLTANSEKETATIRDNLLKDTWEWDGTSWTRVATTGPSARANHAMAYDSARGRVVLFGGGLGVSKPSGEEDLIGDTWEWDGRIWTRVATTGPPPSWMHSMAYDSARGRIILLSYTDTWEWDGINWTRVATTGPSSRSGAAMAYDSLRGRTVLFGGRGSSPTFKGDTWEWDGRSWTQVADKGPSGRWEHAMAYDSARGCVVLFGGYNYSAGGSCEQTWEWDGTKWMQIPVKGPYCRHNHAMAYDSARGRIILFGGVPNTYERDMWEYLVLDECGYSIHPTSREISAAEQSGHTIAVATASDCAWTAASDVPWITITNGNSGSGDGTVTYNVSANLNNATRYGTITAAGQIHAVTQQGKNTINGVWTLVSTTGPAEREGHAMVFDNTSKQTLLFGGLSNEYISEIVFYDDTWTWNGTMWNRMAVSGPSGRAYHTMARDSARGKIVLFGGLDENFESLTDTWEWNGMSWTQAATVGPSPGDNYTMAYDGERGQIVLFGGQGESGFLNETWGWKGTNWTLLATTGPPARWGSAMVSDSTRGRIVLFGGYDNNGSLLSDTWEWNGTNWTQVATIGPDARINHAMAFDPMRRRVVLFGGYGGPDSVPLYFNDTWEWNGSNWSRVNTQSAPSRTYHSMTCDTVRQRIVLFGGWENSNDYTGSLGDTWEYYIESLLSGPEIIRRAFLRAEFPATSADLNSDGIVDVADLLMALQ